MIPNYVKNKLRHKLEGHNLKKQWLFPGGGIRGVYIFLLVFSPTMNMHYPTTIGLNFFSFNQATPRSASSW